MIPIMTTSIKMDAMDKEQLEQFVLTLPTSYDLFKVIHAVVNKTEDPDLDSVAKKRVTNDLKRLCGHTTRSLKALYREPAPVFVEYLVTAEPSIILDHNPYKFDDIFSKYLNQYDLYFTDDQKRYPFIKILIEDKILQYSFFRFIGQLPFYLKVSSDMCLPSVDHVYKDPFDNRRCSMRYCTRQSNNANKCRVKGTHNRLHGMEGSNFTEAGDIDMQVIIWCNMFDIYLRAKTLPFKECDVKHIDLEGSCKAKEFLNGFKKHAMLMDQFVDEMLRMSTDTVYTKSTTANDIPVASIKDQGLNLLADIWDKYMPKDIPIYQRRFDHDYVGALYYDITRFIRYGEFAHLNFIKRKPASVLEIPTHILDPVDILNMFEQEQDPTHLDDYHKRLGFDVEPGKIKKYVKEGRNIRSVWADRDPHYKSILVQWEEGTPLTNITVYKACSIST